MARGKAKKAELSIEEKLQQALVPVDEQPYEVPDNWCWTKLNYVGKWGSGGTPSRKNPSFYDGDIPWIKTGELIDGYIYNSEEKITQEAIDKSSAKVFPINTVAVAMYGATIGKVGLFKIKAATNQACACCVCNKYIDFKWLFWFLQSQKMIFIAKGKGGAQPNISQEIIKEHEVPLPPLPEQQRIVERIESLFAKLDEVKEKLEAVVDSYETRKAAILHKAFTGELTKKWREENGVSDDSWKCTRLGDICKFIGGGTPSKNVKEYWNGNIPWASVKDIKAKELYDTIDHITLEGIENSATNICDVGDLLIVTRIEPGKSIIARNRIAINQDLKIVKTSVNNVFLHYALQNLKKDFSERSSGSTVQGITVGNMSNINVLLPSSDEQIIISEVVEKLLCDDMKIADLSNDTISKIDLLKKSILARAFRGELGTNISDESSSFELLKEILREKD